MNEEHAENRADADPHEDGQKPLLGRPIIGDRAEDGREQRDDRPARGCSTGGEPLGGAALRQRRAATFTK